LKEEEMSVTHGVEIKAISEEDFQAVFWKAVNLRQND
jgi:hypothetical protein